MKTLSLWVAATALAAATPAYASPNDGSCGPEAVAPYTSLFDAARAAAQQVSPTPSRSSLIVPHQGLWTPVYFNHMLVYVSDATIHALQTNAYLNKIFADVQVRTTVRPDMTYTGTYLNFGRTYLEFFPFGTFGAPRGAAGIAQGAGYRAIVSGVQGAFGEGTAEAEMISRDIGGRPTPWFQLASARWAEDSPTLGWWTQQYVPALEGSTTPGTRTEFLAPVYAEDKLARNVEAAVLAGADPDRANLLRTWNAVGVRTFAAGSSGYVALTAPDPDRSRAYIVSPATPLRQGGIGFLISLNHWAPTHDEPLGDALLHVEGTHATLWLVPPTAEELAATRAFAH